MYPPSCCGQGRLECKQHSNLPWAAASFVCSLWLFTVPSKMDALLPKASNSYNKFMGTRKGTAPTFLRRGGGVRGFVPVSGVI